MQSCILYFDIFLLKKHKKATRRSICSAQHYAQLTMTISNFIDSYQASLTMQQMMRGGWDKIVAGTSVKEKIG